MKFTVDRDVLADAVTWVARALPTRPPVPVLAGIRISATEDIPGILTLSTFDYEVSARVEVEADIHDYGTILVSGRLVADICRLLPHKPVTVALEGPKAQLSCGSSRFTLLTMPVEDYPNLPVMPGLSGTIDGAAFSEAISQVTIAATRDETLPLLTCVRMELAGDSMTLLATDRYRLAKRRLRWKPESEEIEGVALVRARTLSDVAKTLGGSGQLGMALSRQQPVDLIGFEADGRHTTSLVVDGEYPPVNRLFPDSNPIRAVMNVAALTEAVRRVALVAERNTPIRMVIHDGQTTLAAGAGDDAQANETISAKLEGDRITVAFNPQFLLDGLGALSTDFVRLGMSEPNKPVLFTGQESLDGDDLFDYQYLLVPIRYAG